MACEEQTGRARRFREAALPCLDDAYRFALFLTRNRTDAEDAVQECYRRALQHFDSWRGPALKPWLLAILRNVCAEMARRGRRERPAGLADDEQPSVWQQPQALPESELLNGEQRAAILRLVAALPAEFREVIVMREYQGMSYREIAGVVQVPLGTVMSRLARARALLLAGWKADHRRAENGTGANAQKPSDDPIVSKAC